MANKIEFRRSDTNELLLNYTPEDIMFKSILDELNLHRTVYVRGKYYFRRVVDMIRVDRDISGFETMVIPITETTIIP